MNVDAVSAASRDNTITLSQDTTPMAAKKVASPEADNKNLRKLCSLVRFHGEELMRGSTKLSLSIDALQVILRLVAGDVADLAADGSDPLLFEAACLQGVLKSVLKLKICRALSRSDLPVVVDLGAFEQLCSLEVVGVALECISGLGPLARRLVSITLENCRFKAGIRDFFVDAAVSKTIEKREAEENDGIEEAVEWPELREVNILRNDLTSLDSSLTLAPRLKILDASYNNLTDAGVDCLGRFGQLTRMNLSFNCLKHVPSFGPGSGVFLHTLLLRNNSLENLNGLESLISLKILDVSFNIISWPGACEALKSLSALTALHLDGNPLYYGKNYRTSVLSHLHPSLMTRKFSLDGKVLSPFERDAIRDAALDRYNLAPAPVPQLELNSTQNTHDMETSSFGGASQCSSQPRAKARRVREAPIASTDDLAGSFGSRSSNIAQDRAKNLHVVRAIVENPKGPPSPVQIRRNSPAERGSPICCSTPVDVTSTRDKLKALRNQYGSDNWLGALAAAPEAAGILGIPRGESPVKQSAEDKHNSVIQPAPICRSMALSGQIEPKVAENEQLVSDESESFTEEVEDVVSYPCGSAGSDEMRPLKCCLVGSIDADGRLKVSEIIERDASTRSILSRWDVYSLTKVEVDASDEPAKISLTFKTMRKDAQSRSYLMSGDSCWALSEFLHPYWQEKDAEGNDFGAWECVKCSSQFAKETKNYDPKRGKNVRCPICGSDLVVSLEGMPEPKSVKPSHVEKLAPRCSSAESNDDRSSSSTPKPKFEPGSRGGSQPVTTIASDASSDIEVLSKASSSSIEVLSREEPDGVEEDAPRQGITRSGESPVGSCRSGKVMTSSTSSESMTASYHTAYNLTNKTSSSLETNASSSTIVGTATTGVALKTFANAVVSSKPSASLSSSYMKLFAEAHREVDVVQKDAIKPVIDALNRGRTQSLNCQLEDLDDTVEDKDFYSLSVLKALAASQLAVGGGKRRRAKDALYFLNERLGTRDSSLDSTKSFVIDDVNASVTELMMKYDYDSFKRFDHRLSLHCDIGVFKSSAEELVFVARGELMPSGLDQPFAGLLAISTEEIYVLRINGKETEDPEKWLELVDSKPVDQLKGLSKIVGSQGLVLQFRGHPKSPWVIFFTGDAHRTSNLIHALSDNIGITFELDCSVLVDVQMCQLETSLIDFLKDDSIDPCFVYFAMGYCKISEGSWDLAGVMLTASHVCLSRGDFKWMFSSSNGSAMSPVAAKRPDVVSLFAVFDLSNVEIHDKLPSALSMVFVDRATKSKDFESIGLAEGRAVRDTVYVAFETPRTMRDFLKQLQAAWSSLFSGAELAVVSSCPQIV
ncbi:unnamed protein product [Notodromas monacha]|uniref:Serine/threonine-protein kinase 11-interacting protein n=1 Tax=Notodromas monacha TaxID=399045 RepID=A0A7R9BXG1_9CRUS|nr:unnamed protein product [Notodromas monacha]CAG0923148.1 unnamed protein product [Notodromas monacha]